MGKIEKQLGTLQEICAASIVVLKKLGINYEEYIKCLDLDYKEMTVDDMAEVVETYEHIEKVLAEHSFKVYVAYDCITEDVVGYAVSKNQPNRKGFTIMPYSIPKEIKSESSFITFLRYIKEQSNKNIEG